MWLRVASAPSGVLPALKRMTCRPSCRDAPRHAGEALSVQRREALDVEDEEADGRVLGEVLEEVRGGEVHLVAVRDGRPREHDAVEVARERHEVRPALADGHEAVARRVVERQLVLRKEERVVLPLRDDPEAVSAHEHGPAVRPRVRGGQRRADTRLEIPVARLAESARNQDHGLGPAARQGLHDLRRGRRRHRHDREVHRLGQSVHGRDARHAVDRLLLRVHREQVPVRDALGLLEVPEDDPARIHRVSGGADDGGAPGSKEPGDLGEGTRRESEAPVGHPGLSVRDHPSAVRAKKKGIDLELLERRIAKRILGRIERKILRKGFEQRRDRIELERRLRVPPIPFEENLQRRSLARLPARRPRSTSPGWRITVVAPGASSPYHSVRRPPRPKTRTGPNAGSCLKERSASAAGVPDGGNELLDDEDPEALGSGRSAGDVFPHRPRRSDDRRRRFL